LNQKDLDKKLLFIFLGLAIGFRLFLFFLSDYAISPDSQAYIRNAQFIRDFKWENITESRPLFYPAMIALVSKIVSDYELSGSLVSLFFSAILVIPVFYLGREIFDSKTAFWASLMVIFYPWFTLYSFQVLTESAYVTLVLLGLLFGWLGFKKNDVSFFSLSALFFGLVYLTRTEGLTYAPFMVLAILMTLGRRLLSLKRLKILLAFIITYLIISAPYLIFLHKKTGSWLPSGHIQFMAVHIEEGTEFQDMKPAETYGFLKKKWKPFLLKYIKNLRNSLIYGLPTLINPFLLVLLGLGLFKRPWQGESGRGRLYLSLMVLPPFLTTTVSHVNPRYYLVVVPILILFVAQGALEMQKWMETTIQQEKGLPCLLKRILSTQLLIPLVVVICFGLMAIFPLFRESFNLMPIYGIEYKETGLWLRENTPKEAIILSQKGQIDYYAQRQALSIRFPGNKRQSLTLDQVLSLASDPTKEYYLIIDERWKARLTELSFLLNEERAPPSLESVYINTKHPKAKVVVYRVKLITQ